MNDDKTIADLLCEDIDQIEFKISNNGFTTRELLQMQNYVYSLTSKIEARIETNDW